MASVTSSYRLRGTGPPALAHGLAHTLLDSVVEPKWLSLQNRGLQVRVLPPLLEKPAGLSLKGRLWDCYVTRTGPNQLAVPSLRTALIRYR